MSPKSTYTSPSREAHNGSAQSEYTSRVDTQPNADYEPEIYSTHPEQTTSSTFRGYPPEQNSQHDQYANGTQAHVAPAFRQADSRPTMYPTSHTSPYQDIYYTAAPVYPPGDAMYPREFSAEDVQNTSAHDSTRNQVHLTRCQGYPNNGYNARPYTPASGQASTQSHRMYARNEQAQIPPSPPSPQAQRYIEASTPEERMRLGLPRFADEQQQMEYCEQQQTYYYAQLNSNDQS